MPQLQAELGGVELPHETLAELVKIDEVEAIKEATFDAFKYQQTVEFLRGLPKRIQEGEISAAARADD